MGHSLGAYLLMEILRRRQSRLETTGRVIGVIGLFPALVHLAKSEGGRRAQRFLAVPGLVLPVIWLARMLGLLPTKILHEGIRVFLGYSDHAVKTTAHWIRSQWGVEQSMYVNTPVTFFNDIHKLTIWSFLQTPWPRGAEPYLK